MSEFDDLLLTALYEDVPRGRLAKLPGGFSGAELFQLRGGQKIILKLLRSGPVIDAGWNIAATEARAYTFLSSINFFGIPKLLAIHQTNSPPLIGILMEECTPIVRTAGVFTFLGQMHKQLSALVDKAAFSRITMDNNSWTWGWACLRQISDSAQRFKLLTIDKIFADCSSLNLCVTKSLLHGDMALENLMRTSTGVVAIDWENFSIGPISVDFGSLYASIYGLDFSNLDLALEEYFSAWHPLGDLRFFRIATIVEICRAYATQISGHIRIGNYRVADSIIDALFIKMEKLNEIAFGLR